MAYQHDVAGDSEIYTWHPKVACRTLDGTAFVLSGSRMVSLNDTGTVIWELLERGSTAAQIAQHLAEEYDVSYDAAMEDARAFLHTLIERQMVTTRSAGAAPGGDR